MQKIRILQSDLLDRCLRCLGSNDPFSRVAPFLANTLVTRLQLPVRQPCAERLATGGNGLQLPLGSGRASWDVLKVLDKSSVATSDIISSKTTIGMLPVKASMQGHLNYLALGDHTPQIKVVR